MKKCVQCEQEYSDEKKYCLKCGISLEENMTGGYLNCSHCGTQNISKFAFCKKCGIRLKEDSVKVAVTGQAKDEHSGFETNKPRIDENIVYTEKQGLADEAKKHIMLIAGEAFKKAGINSKGALQDEGKLNTVVGIAHKLLPLPVRAFVKKETLGEFLKELLSQTAAIQTDKVTVLKGDIDNKILQRQEVQTTTPEAGHVVSEVANDPYKGEDIFKQYLRLAASGEGTEATKMELLNRALALGLLPKDEVFSHISIGIQLASLNDLNKAVERYDHALTLASNCEEIFGSDSVMMLCRSVCAAYILKAIATKKLSGIDESLSYLHAKEMLLKQLCSPVFYFELAVLHKEKNPDDFAVISSYYNKTVNCDVLDDMDESSAQKAKDALVILDELLSASNLKVLEKATAPETHAQKKRFSSSVAVAQPEIKGSERSYRKFVIVGVTVLCFIVAALFLKFYLSKTTDQEGKDVVQKPQQIQQQKPVEQLKSTEQQPVIEQAKEQQPTVAVEHSDKPAVSKKQTLPVERVITDQRQKKEATTAKAKQQAVLPEAAKDQEPKEQERKSFAPHSRDDL